jgi:hypothetical protein
VFVVAALAIRSRLFHITAPPDGVLLADAAQPLLPPTHDQPPIVGTQDALSVSSIDGSALPGQGIEQPTARYVRPRTKHMLQQIGVRTTGFFHGDGTGDKPDLVESTREQLPFSYAACTRRTMTEMPAFTAKSG